MSVCDHISQESRSDPKPLISGVFGWIISSPTPSQSLTRERYSPASWWLVPVVIETSHIPTVWSLDRSRITIYGVSREESDVIIFIETPRKSMIWDHILIPVKYEHKRTSDRKVKAIRNLYHPMIANPGVLCPLKKNVAVWSRLFGLILVHFADQLVIFC